MIQNGLASVFDPDTFVQTFAYATSGVTTGYGALGERLVFAACQDAGFLRGSVGKMHAEKVARTIDMAVRQGVPFVLFLDTAGARIEEGLDVLSGYAGMMQALIAASEEIPTVCVVDGACTGAAATVAGLCSFVLMRAEQSRLSIHSAEIVRAAGESCTDAEISGGAAQADAGVCTLLAQDDAELERMLRALISYLPDSYRSGAPDFDGCRDNVNRPCPFCASLRASDAFDVRNVLREIADDGTFLELSAHFAPNLVTALARFGGRVVCVLANQPSVGEGKLSGDACEKAAAMLEFCERFGLPVLTLTACGGICVSGQEEKRGLAAKTARLAAAFSRTHAPKLNLVIGKAYGQAAILMNSRQLGADYAYAWNTAEIAVVAPETGALLLYRDEIAAAADPVQARTDAIRRYRQNEASAVHAAAQCYVDDVIDPAETRARIISIFQMM